MIWSWKRLIFFILQELINFYWPCFQIRQLRSINTIMGNIRRSCCCLILPYGFLGKTEELYYTKYVCTLATQYGHPKIKSQKFPAPLIQLKKLKRCYKYNFQFLIIYLVISICTNEATLEVDFLAQGNGYYIIILILQEQIYLKVS